MQEVSGSIPLTSTTIAGSVVLSGQGIDDPFV
jgi:hypothetical protein